jgi:hypothetical protein
MIDLIEGIGPFLGIAAFLGLVILAFLIFQQAREVRRLREWAGRAPERAAEAAEASMAAAEARGEAAEEPAGEPGRLRSWWGRMRERVSPGVEALDRRMPVDPRYVIAALIAALIAVGVLTSGFGLVGADDAGKGGKKGGAKSGQKKEEEKEPEVAVLNATQFVENGITVEGVQGLATKVAEEVVKPAGFKVAQATDAASGQEATVVMFDEESDEEAANGLADAVREQLGEVDVLPMINEVRERAKGAALALVVGQDDAEF